MISQALSRKSLVISFAQQDDGGEEYGEVEDAQPKQRKRGVSADSGRGKIVFAAMSIAATAFLSIGPLLREYTRLILAASIQPSTFFLCRFLLVPAKNIWFS